MFAVIRVRGKVKIKSEIEDTLHILRLNRKNHCILIPESRSYKGMLQKVKDRITWGEISDDMLQKLIMKRGRKPGNKRLTEEEAKKVAESLKAGNKPEIKPVFRLTPPSKGFKKSIKQHYPNGELGYRKEKINELLEKMI